MSEIPKKTNNTTTTSTVSPGAKISPPSANEVTLSSIAQNLTLLVNAECLKMLQKISKRYNIDEEELRTTFLPKMEKKVVFRKKRNKKTSTKWLPMFSP